MFIVLLKYEKPLEQIDAAMRDHVGFLESCHAAGVFIAAGRQVPRTGGVILAQAPSRDALDEIMRADPFVARGLASFEIVEFRTSLHDPGLRAFADPGTRRFRARKD